MYSGGLASCTINILALLSPGEGFQGGHGGPGLLGRAPALRAPRPVGNTLGQSVGPGMPLLMDRMPGVAIGGVLGGAWCLFTASWCTVVVVVVGGGHHVAILALCGLLLLVCCHCCVARGWRAGGSGCLSSPGGGSCPPDLSLPPFLHVLCLLHSLSVGDRWGAAVWGDGCLVCVYCGAAAVGRGLVDVGLGGWGGLLVVLAFWVPLLGPMSVGVGLLGVCPWTFSSSFASLALGGGN